MTRTSSSKKTKKNKLYLYLFALWTCLNQAKLSVKLFTEMGYLQVSLFSHSLCFHPAGRTCCQIWVKHCRSRLMSLGFTLLSLLHFFYLIFRFFHACRFLFLLSLSCVFVSHTVLASLFCLTCQLPSSSKSRSQEA